MSSSNRDDDHSIRSTDSDAALARFSAVQKQYLRDPFVKHLAPRGARLQPPRPPLINVGTFVRSTAIDDLVDQWFVVCQHEGKRCQIVSLGAGSDTRFWRVSTGPYKNLLASYVEFDFPEVTSQKAMAIRKSKELSAVLGPPETVALGQGGTALHAPVYHLFPADLRLPPSDTVAPLLSSYAESSGDVLDPRLPTLLIFECVLAYMTPAASSALLRYFVDYFAAHGTALGGIVYEMFGLNDSFGRVMRENLKSRNISLPGVDPYPTVASLPTRFTDHGFTYSSALTLRDIRRKSISEDDLERISTLEMLDEIEELELVLGHYAITWGVKLSDTDSTRAEWRSWGLKDKHQAANSDTST
ncbi:hypothetical protein PLICRDRAFT_98074 [Plicaturopsis crispa FD-325 SS-3]|nr:hypothetical protein PLICRDRAFT_98074 [Plicaturopsis crispa FD-325 SS-3]